MLCLLVLLSYVKNVSLQSVVSFIRRVAAAVVTSGINMEDTETVALPASAPHTAGDTLSEGSFYPLQKHDEYIAPNYSLSQESKQLVRELQQPVFASNPTMVHMFYNVSINPRVAYRLCATGQRSGNPNRHTATTTTATIAALAAENFPREALLKLSYA